MSGLRVSNLRGETAGSSPTFPDGVVVTGVMTATSFSGSGASLTGIDATALKDSGGNVKVQANTSGIVVTGVSTFTGNVSVGGTLTYEDVTNVDSVGVITARSGIRIGAGQSVSAVSGIVTYYGDGSKLSGVESGVSNFVASGTISNGATVIVNTDGTVSTVAKTGSSTPSVGTAGIFNNAGTEDMAATFDSNSNKVVVAFKDQAGSDYGTAVVGTVSGTSISFGSEVVFNSANSAYIAATFDSNSNKVVIFYRANTVGGYSYAIVGTVSGTSISFGSAAVAQNSNTSWQAATFDSTNNKVIFTYRDDADSGKGKCKVGTVSGTSISFGSAAVFENASTQRTALTYDSSNERVVVVYTDAGNSSHGTAAVGTVSNTSISFGTPVVFNAASTSYPGIVYDSSNNKVVVAYTDSGNSAYGSARVGTVSGTSISFGTEVVYESAVVTAGNLLAYDSDNGKVVIAYSDQGNSNYGTAVVGTVSGTSISFGSPVVFASSGIVYPGITFDSANAKVVISYQDAGDSSKGKAVPFQSNSLVTNLTTENYIGLAAEAIANGATGKVNILGGVNSGQTGLTTAQTYYVQNGGGVATSASSPSVVAGTSISSTKILIR